MELRYLLIGSALFATSCGGASSRENPMLPDNPLVAVAEPGALVLTSQVDAPIGFLIHAQSSTVNLRWPRCYATISVSVPNVLEARASLTVPAAEIPGYQAGEGAVIYYKVMQRDNRITSGTFYFCVREGQLQVTLR